MEGTGSGGEAIATSSDPAQAERQQKSFHGVLWGMSLDQARERAAAEKKPILIDFTGVNCANCRQMESGVFPLPEITSLLEKFVTVQLYTDFVPIDSIPREQRKARAEINQELEAKLGETTNPFYVAMSPSGDVISSIGGYNEPKVFSTFLERALEKFANLEKAAPGTSTPRVSQNAAGTAASPALVAVKATSTDPARAEREEKKAHGVLWGLSYDQALERAAAEKKPILIDFSRHNCQSCHRMRHFVFPRPEVVALLNKFVTLELYLDAVPIDSLPGDQRAKLAVINQERLKRLDPNGSNPYYIVLSPGGEIIEKIGGFREPPVFAAFLNRALEKFPTIQVAQAVAPAQSKPESDSR
jgi:thioredoxin-related protein